MAKSIKGNQLFQDRKYFENDPDIYLLIPNKKFCVVNERVKHEQAKKNSAVQYSLLKLPYLRAGSKKRLNVTRYVKPQEAE